MILTRKIELLIAEDDKTRRKEIWKYLREVELQVFQAANLIVSNQYFNQAFKDRILLTDEDLSNKREKLDSNIAKLKEKIDAESDSDKKDKLIAKRKKCFSQRNKLTTEARLKAEELYTTSEKNTTYQIIGKEFPNLPSHIRISLNDMVTKNFSNEFFDVSFGKRSLRTYRKGMPIPFFKSGMRFTESKDGIQMNWVAGITFNLRFGKDFSNNRAIVDRVMDGTYKASDSQVQIKKGKIFLLLCVDIPDNENNLDDNLSVGVDLGISVPAYCGLSEGKPRMAIGSREDLLRVRIQMQKRQRQLQRNLKLAKGGRGRTKKLKALERIKEKERNYVKTYNHTVSYQIVKFAKDNGAGVIKLEFLKGYGEDEPNSFLLRNWSYFELQTKVEYKAKREGMKVVYIDPYHTSQTCSSCGHYEEDQRISQSEFLCKNPDCTRKDKKGNNEVVNADWNASINIARSNHVVTSKSECEYFIRKKAESNKNN